MTNRWPPQPGDLVKVERSTAHDADEEGANAMIGKVCEVDRCCSTDGGFVSVWQPHRKDWWYFNLSDLSPAEPPQIIEQFGRTYRLDEGWQPIETAPKDGRRIWGWFPYRQECFTLSWSFNDYDEDVNWTLDDGESACCTHGKPTHWMPLPAPPAAKEPTP